MIEVRGRRLFQGAFYYSYHKVKQSMDKGVYSKKFCELTFSPVIPSVVEGSWMFE